MSVSKIKSRPLIIIALIPIIASLGLIFITAGKSFSDSSRPQPLRAEARPVVATVDGREISAKIYQVYLKNGIETVGLSDQSPEGRRKIELLKEGIISELIDRALIEAEARRRGLSFTREQFESQRALRIDQMGGPDLYRAYLAENNLTEEEFASIITGEIYADLLRVELGKAATVSESEARDFYAKEISNPRFQSLFTEPERVRASHILISARRAQLENELKAKGNYDRAQLDRLIADVMTKRRARAAEILSRAQAGIDFARLARESSDDAGTRGQGGDLGLFERNTHTRNFDDAAFALKPGQMSGVVETDYGYHIIKVTERRQARTKSFGEVRPAIQQQILARKKTELLTRWLDERRAASSIEVTPFYRVGRFQTSGR